jgi:DNA topoisomerase VI subunit B
VSGTDQETYAEFSDAVNMTARELERWLEGDEAQDAGQKKDDSSESTGHASGRHILAILATKKADLTEADHAHMRKVVGYVKRHQAQRPDGDVTETRWRYSLMNWGHDPHK